MHQLAIWLQANIVNSLSFFPLKKTKQKTHQCSQSLEYCDCDTGDTSMHLKNNKAL